MKIGIPIFAFGKSGGARVLSELATRMVTYGNDVTFICFGDSISPYFPTIANIIWVNYKGQQLKTNNLKTKHYPLRYFFIRKIFRRIIEKFGADWDIILATHSFTAYPVSLAKISARKFYYIQAYETEYYRVGGLKHYFYKNVANASYKLGLKHIVNCELYLDYKDIKAAMFVYPGIDLEIFVPKSKTLLEKKDKFILGCIGRVEKIKGTHLVLKAFEILKNNYKNIELHVAFGNSELSSISGIKVINPNNDSELANFYRSVDVIIAPGTVQLGAIHYPVLESFASGTAVITTGYSRADQTNSFIVPINDTISIVNYVKYIIENPEMAQIKIEKAKEIVFDFAWDIVTQKMLNYFK